MAIYDSLCIHERYFRSENSPFFCLLLPSRFRSLRGRTRDILHDIQFCPDSSYIWQKLRMYIRTCVVRFSISSPYIYIYIYCFCIRYRRENDWKYFHRKFSVGRVTTFAASFEIRTDTAIRLSPAILSPSSSREVNFLFRVCVHFARFHVDDFQKIERIVSQSVSKFLIVTGELLLPRWNAADSVTCLLYHGET